MEDRLIPEIGIIFPVHKNAVCEAIMNGAVGKGHMIGVQDLPAHEAAFIDFCVVNSEIGTVLCYQPHDTAAKKSAVRNADMAAVFKIHHIAHAGTRGFLQMPGCEVGDDDILTITEGEHIGIAGSGLDGGFILSLPDDLHISHPENNQFRPVKLLLPTVELTGSFP